MGDRVKYYIGPKSTGVTANWQRSVAVEFYDKEAKPYDPSYYIKKLDEWRNRYVAFYPTLLDNPDQGELF